MSVKISGAKVRNIKVYASSLPPPSPPCILDPYIGNLWTAAGAARLLSSYSGPILRVRRSSDNREQDIMALSSNTLDTQSLITFVGSGNGFLVRLYDQTGQANHWTPNTTGNQPQIVSSGQYLNGFRTNGISQNIITDNSTPNTPNLTFLIRYTILSNISVQTIMAQSWDDAGTKTTGLQYLGSGNGFFSNTSAVYTFDGNFPRSDVYVPPGPVGTISTEAVYAQATSTVSYPFNQALGRNGSFPNGYWSNNSTLAQGVNFTNSPSNRVAVGARFGNGSLVSGQSANILVEYMAIWTSFLYTQNSTLSSLGTIV